uniref:Thymocyte selection associated family member 2 n=1 Tax=Oryzias melastigma TaxID=30732 RepID=A0A3B3DRL8_ORYME
MAGAFALPLQEYFASLDETSLPKILQVCSGVYFQGSVYELSGSEVCFSTGDLIKVIGLELHSVSCQDVLNNENFELPITHTGWFETHFSKMFSLPPFPDFSMTVGDLTLGAGRMLTVLSIEQQEGQEDQVRCHLKGSQETSAEVCIPMSFRGEFYECESEETLWIRLLSLLHLSFFSPAVRKNALKFPSSLEIDVVDITNTSQDIEFVTPLSLTEVMSQPDEMFPTVVAILDPPVNHFMFKSTWTAKLNKETRLLLHKKTTKSFMLLSTPKSRKTQQYFLVCPQYKGRFRKRPREFNSAYELYVASTQTGSLNVSVTKNCEEDVAEGLPALSVGEKLEIVCCTRMELSSENSKEETQSVEALLCQRLQEQDDEDDSDSDEEGVEKDDKKDEVFLPLYMQGHFVEVLSDNKKYKLSDLGENCSLPLDMKVVSRDTELETDPLSGFSCLRLEAIISEPVIQASFLHKPEHCFDIPIQWLSMNVIFTKDSLPEGQPPKCYVEKVTEVNDYFFYEFRKQACSNEAPPPRPPKRSLPTEKSSKKASKSKKKTGKTNKTKHRKESAIPIEEMNENSDHDYETLDENLVAMMKTAQESVVFY